MKCLPSAFANRVGLTLADLKGRGVENGLDDILVATTSFGEHLELAWKEMGFL